LDSVKFIHLSESMCNKRSFLHSHKANISNETNHCHHDMVMLLIITANVGNETYYHGQQWTETDYNFATIFFRTAAMWQT